MADRGTLAAPVRQPLVGNMFGSETLLARRVGLLDGADATPEVSEPRALRPFGARALLWGFEKARRHRRGFCPARQRRPTFPTLQDLGQTTETGANGSSIVRLSICGKDNTVRKMVHLCPRPSPRIVGGWTLVIHKITKPVIW